MELFSIRIQRTFQLVSTVINLFLIAINWFTSPHYWWVLWVIAGWGISLLMTAIEKSIKY